MSTIHDVKIPADILEKLHATLVIEKEVIEQFQKDGFVQLKNLISRDVLNYFRDSIMNIVKAKSADELALEDRDTYGKAFLQISNIWTMDKMVKEFTFSKLLASVATQLLEVSGVRMYHDQALYKEPGGGITPWHVDQVYWPLSNKKTVTAWIPLVPVTREMGPLGFAKGSHQMDLGRDHTISDESEELIKDNILRGGVEYHCEPFDLGDVSFHFGYTFHNAGTNETDIPRQIMTIIYMDKEMKLTEPESIFHKNDLKSWMPGQAVGETIDTPLNPVLHTA